MDERTATARSHSLARAALDEPAWVPYGEMFTSVISGKIAVVVPHALDDDGAVGSLWWVEHDNEISGGFSPSVKLAQAEAQRFAGYQPQVIDIVADILRNNQSISGHEALKMAKAAKASG